MHTSTPTIPASPSSHTAALWPAEPGPLHWPRPVVDARALMAARRAAASLTTVRAMVAELVAMEMVSL